MAAQDIGAALERVESVLRRRPEAGLHDDAPATSRWRGGTSVVTHHANGSEVPTDLPAELGGNGDHVTPGWLLRGALASCAATRIAMAAAAERIELQALEVQVTSRSDLRGLLGMKDADGQLVTAGLLDMQMQVRIRAPGVAPDRLRAFAEAVVRVSPMSCTVQEAVPVAVRIDIDNS
jgi:uncharacterized OsmC-like protein